MTDFYDSASQRFPAGAEYVALYGDGDFKATLAGSRKYAHVRWITVMGDYATCGIADYEAGNAVFSSGVLRAWAEGRKRMGCLARVYSNEANFKLAYDAVGDLPNVRWWLALYDGEKTAGELAEIFAAYAPVRAGVIWGQQFTGDPTGGYDQSVLLGDW